MLKYIFILYKMCPWRGFVNRKKVATKLNNQILIEHRLIAFLLKQSERFLLPNLTILHITSLTISMIKYMAD